MPYIDVIPYEDADGELKAIYDQLISSRGKLAAVHTIQSLNPRTIVSHMQLYQDIMFGSSPLKRHQREMMAVVVSAANGCAYCVAHHREALLHYWRDAGKAALLIRDPALAGLNETDLALCTLATELTKHPGQAGEGAVVALRKAGLSDRGVLDATLVVAYFNFVNRVVLGLGLEVVEGETGGYRYD